ncbi:MAG: Urea carboxylase [Frankiales bacterium]|nr:Urea carboxylase [Frankiales bacterium]
MTAVGLLTRTCTVLEPGMQTTVQDLPGRTGLWSVGVPPSGAWDDLSASLANLAVGNAAGAALLEAVVRGPVLSFGSRTLVCVTGAAVQVTLDGRPVPPGRPVVVTPGSVLDVGPLPGPGMRAYVAVAGGLDLPAALGSRATFLLGAFGGLQGRALQAGDSLPLRSDENCAPPRDVAELLPQLRTSWQVRVIPGPHGAPEHLTPAGVAELFGATWQLDHRADRTGVRLVGPRPGWARTDGGDAGLHPSNVHDSAYPVGGIMLSGDTPVIVGPDGPSLGGFVVPAVVVRADRWILAQARPGDEVRLVPVTPEEAERLGAERRELLGGRPGSRPAAPPTSPDRPPALLSLPAEGDRPALTVRRSGDHHLLVEAGPPVLDLAVRWQVHLLALAVRDLALPGLVETVEGVRSILFAVDEARLTLPELARHLHRCWETLPDPASVSLPVREVTLPLSLDDPAAHEAMARYVRGVRPDAPWCPDNVEFIRRVNALDTRADVFDVVTAATYVVIGLGDVYLGAPVAVPLDPRHRLVTTKYDPPRTWTPANAVGIGGVYLCVYGMEGPGGYQLVGRTVPVWRLDPGSPEPPWLLRQFDLLRFRPVGADELLTLRADIAAGRRDLETRETTMTLAGLLAAEHAAAADGGAADFTARRQAAFSEERGRWEAGS